MRGVPLVKRLVPVAVLVLAVARGAAADEESDEELYKRIFDDVDIDSILNNDRILDTYVRCFLNKGPCSDLADVMKGKIPEVFETVCGKCSDKQKGLFKHSLEVFIPKRPDDWKGILEIYDPKGEYWPKIKAFLESGRRR